MMMTPAEEERATVLEALYVNTRLQSTKTLRRIFELQAFRPAMLTVVSDAALLHKTQLPVPPLHYAAMHGHLGMLKLMLSRIPESELMLVDIPYNNLSPLLFAIRARCVHCITALLNAGADPNFNVDPEVMTPLRYAVEECANAGIAEVLLEFDAESRLETRFNSPVQFVCARLSPCADAEERVHWEGILDRMDPYCYYYDWHNKMPAWVPLD